MPPTHWLRGRMDPTITTPWPAKLPSRHHVRPARNDSRTCWWAGGSAASQRRSTLAVRIRACTAETVILLHPPLHLVGVSMRMERGCQRNDRSLVDGSQCLRQVGRGPHPAGGGAGCDAGGVHHAELVVCVGQTLPPAGGKLSEL